MVGIILGGILGPGGQTPLGGLDEVFGGGDGGARGVVEFVHVVNLAQAGGVFGIILHHILGAAAYLLKERHADREIRGPEHCQTRVGHHLLHLGAAAEPAGGAGNQGHACGKAAAVVVDSCGGGGELDGHVGAAELGGVHQRLLALIDMTHDGVAALKSYFFYGMAHFTVSYEGYFHYLSNCSKLFYTNRSIYFNVSSEKFLNLFLSSSVV